MAPAKPHPSPRRKLIAFDAETWMALDLLSQDRMASIQELADEAFADLLKKHHRPTTLKEALRESGRSEGASRVPAPKTSTRTSTRGRRTGRR